MTANDFVDKVKHLTPVSHAALNLVGLLNNPTTGNDAIVYVLKFDNVLTAKLLRACNSPFFGLDEPVSSVEQAVFLLGHQQILHIALSIAFSSIMNAPLPGHAAEAKELWQHSLITALAAENIAKNNTFITADASVAFTAGLLHDIGNLVLNHTLTPDRVSAIQARMAQGGLARSAAERAVLGVDHAEVGRCLLQSWRLPDKILEAVGNHHQPVSQPQPQLSSLVHAANCLAHQIGTDLGWEAFIGHADPGVVKALGINPEMLDALLIAAHDSMSQVQNLMKIG